jgi:hydroxymethylglutaryl-CoA lyase
MLLDDLGCDHLTLADTGGTTTPARVTEVLTAVGDAFGSLDRIGVHLHDRSGAAIANAYRAWQLGVRIFDGSLGGIGGSVSANVGRGGTRPAGNIATESLVALFHGLGVETGIDLDALLTGAGPLLRDMCRIAGDFDPPSQLLRERLGFGLRWEAEGR